jgi:serine/threonine-protein kinase
MLDAGEPKSLPTVIRAIGKIGDQRCIEHLLPMLQRPENEIKVEAIAALAKLADERRAETNRASNSR